MDDISLSPFILNSLSTQLDNKKKILEVEAGVGGKVI